MPSTRTRLGTCDRVCHSAAVLQVRTALTIVLAVAALATAACEPAPAPAVRAFRVTAPAAAVELVPTPADFVDVVWTYDADDAEHLAVTIQAVPTVGETSASWLASALLANGSARYVVPAVNVWVPPLNVVPAGVYQVLATVYADGDVLAESTAPGLLVLQGVEFRDRDLTFTSDVAQRDLWMTTVTATVARATVYLTSAVGGARQVISQATIASDLAPVGRVITFTGRTINDVLESTTKR